MLASLKFEKQSTDINQYGSRRAYRTETHTVLLYFKGLCISPKQKKDRIQNTLFDTIIVMKDLGRYLKGLH